MKYIIILADGCSDYPIEKAWRKNTAHGGNTPNIDALCAQKPLRLLKTVPDDMPPGSEIANMAVLGYDVHEVYQGRGVLEAASMGVDLKSDDLAMRCNLICIDQEGKIKNHSAGHITTPESHELITFLNEKLAGENSVSSRSQLPSFVCFYNGSNQIRCTPPHDVPGTPGSGM
jgi:2,3-bisphosphoglycerate-independent phosphoglycerate mutase